MQNLLPTLLALDVLNLKTGSLPASPDPSPRRARAPVEAARHAVLQRLAPALRHDMVVNLQAVAMMAETLSARMERDGQAQGDMSAQVAKLNRLAREAVLKCLSVAGWIEQSEDDSVPLRSGVEECVALLSSGFNFRGFSLACEVEATDFEVPRAALRYLLTASLITLTDTAPAPCDLRVRSELDALHATLDVECTPRGASDGHMEGGLGPRIEWADVQALASAEGVEATRSTGHIRLRFTRAVTTPLRMAPV